MIRIFIAALLLKSTGAAIEYRVQRNKHQTGKDGTTYMRTGSYRAAMRKFASMRTAYTDTINVRLVATVAHREGEEVTDGIE